jgi:hypothetical protein
MDACSVTDCSEPIFVKMRRLCRKHYHRWYRTGDPLQAKYDRADGTPLERWWAKVDKTDGCWLWIGGLDRRGYGQFDVTTDGKRRNHRAHRWGYEQLVRQLDPAETIDHLCRVHNCVNPEHLDPVLHAENVRRGDGGKHNATKTHCPQGHPYDEANTYYLKRGGRSCRACTRKRTREINQRKRVAAKEGMT